MITKEKIKEYFEQEIENHGKLVYLLYRDKKLLNEERFDEFARELLERSRKAYWGSLAVTIVFFAFGSMYLLNSSFAGSFNQFAGFSYITLSLINITICTKEYYSIKGSMTMLLKLFEVDEVSQSRTAPELETT